MKKWVMLCAMLFSVSAFAYPNTFLEMTSPQGDYIGGGVNHYYTEGNGVFNAYQQYWGNPEYRDNSLTVSFSGSGHWWYLDFSTHALNVDLGLGSYEAMRFPFESPGFAGLSVWGDGRGCNTLLGSFTVLDLAWGAGATVDRFAATFEQRCEGFMAPLTGKISYNSDAFNDVPEPAPFALLAIGMGALFVARKRAAR
jgi:hypothetical protein